jgi:hypothetical protein
VSSTLSRCPPSTDAITSYDEAHFAIYLRLLDAETAGVPWETAARLVLNLDVEKEPDRARHIWEANLARAEWITQHGYRYLVKSGT